MKTVVLINQFHSDNIGDKLLNYALRMRLVERGHHVINLGFAQTTEQEVLYERNITGTFLQKIKYNTPSFMKYVLRYHKALLGERQAIDWTTIGAIIVGGGQLLKHLTIFKYCLMFWYCVSKKYHIPFILYGVGVDNDLDYFERMIYKKILRCAHYINCRDKTSAMIVKQLIGRNVVITPDIAFTYEIPSFGENKNNVLIAPYNYNVYQKAFGYSGSREDYYKLIMNIINVKIDLERHPIILSATTSSDALECFSFRKFLKYRGIDSYLIEAKTVPDIVALLKKSKYLISGRMHAMILSLLCNVIPIAIPVSEKIETFQMTYITNEVNIEMVRREAYKGAELLDGVLKAL